MAEHLSVPGKTVLLEEGKVADKLYMIRKGCLRLSFFNDGRDITFQFFFEGDVVASFNSLHHRQPSLFSLETLEPAELSVIKKNDFYDLIQRIPSLRQAYEEKTHRTVPYLSIIVPLTHQEYAAAALRRITERASRHYPEGSATLYRLLPRYYARLFVPNPKQTLISLQLLSSAFIVSANFASSI